MRYLSVCSGIEAATVAWHPLGWEAAAFSEIERFPRAVLAHHYPDVPLHGDFTTIKGDEYGPIDLLVGGTPCQSFSVAGLRKGMDAPRGNLALGFLGLAARTRARWVVWENVPGVLSSNGGRDFGSFLGGLGELGYGFAYRVLDAQYCGVPQRRRRVFVVGYLGDWRPAAAVLFERHSLSGHHPPRRKAGQRVAPTVSGGAPYCRTGNERVEAEALITGFPPGSHGGYRHGVGTLRSDGGDIGGGSETLMVLASAQANAKLTHDLAPTLITHSLTASIGATEDGTGRGTPLVPAHPPAIAFGFDGGQPSNPKATHQYTVEGTGPIIKNRPPMVGASGMAVRRITPREAERLQGFPDDYTAVLYRGKPAADGPRYRALGNSMAVPVMRWIGERIQQEGT